MKHIKLDYGNAFNNNYDRGESTYLYNNGKEKASKRNVERQSKGKHWMRSSSHKLERTECASGRFMNVPFKGLQMNDSKNNY